MLNEAVSSRFYDSETVVAEEQLIGEGGYARGAERALLSALLFDGIQAFLTHGLEGARGSKRRYAEALAWVTHRDSDYVFSYESVCEALGVDAKWLRKGLLNLAVSKAVEVKKKNRRRN